MRTTYAGRSQPTRGGRAQRQLGIGRRRLLFFSLVAASILMLTGGLAVVLSNGGLTALEIAMILLFALNLPWMVIGLWNSIIGFVLLLSQRDAQHGVPPIAGIGEQPWPPFGRIAVVMPVHEEDPASVFRFLRATAASLDATGRSEPFDIFLLSDTQDERLAERERALFTAWQHSDRRPNRLHYRRRAERSGFKAGNLRDFCDRWGAAYECMIVLDADSMMSGATILRLTEMMRANRRLGIVQTLILGLPSSSAFARIFQFGIRHGMRTYTVGSAWWQGDAGSYWGHNAIIRLEPFIEHCRLPRIAGPSPLSGEALSHDQIEAVLMRSAGWEVRVLPYETGSFEAAPPTLLDFIKRDLRWCHGNMQYARLLGLAGSNRLGRLQMLLAVLMYARSPCWLAFSALALLQIASPRLGWSPGVLIPEPAGLPGDAIWALSATLFAVVIVSTWAPKLLGLLQALSERSERRRYGGAGKLVGGGVAELSFSMLLAPVMIAAQTLFMACLLFGGRPGWTAQLRRNRRISVAEAARELWPQTLLGIIATLLLVMWAPNDLPWAAPLLAGLLLAIPFAVATTSRRLGRLLVTAGLCATPEELSPPPEVRAVCGWLSTSGLPSSPTTAAGRMMSAEAVP